MGKLIKNHWARLVILTAAACKSQILPAIPNQPIFTTNTHIRPSRRSPRGLLLAQDLLGLSHKEPRLGCQTLPNPANHQHAPRIPGPDVGVALAIARGHRPAPLNRSTPDRIPSECTLRAPDLPGHELRTVLHHRHGRVLLGVQRRRGEHIHFTTSESSTY